MIVQWLFDPPPWLIASSLGAAPPNASASPPSLPAQLYTRPESLNRLCSNRLGSHPAAHPPPARPPACRAPAFPAGRPCPESPNWFWLPLVVPPARSSQPPRDSSARECRAPASSGTNVGSNPSRLRI